MRPLRLALLSLVIAASQLAAQGTVNFINANAPVRTCSPDRLLDNLYAGQLYASATGADGTWVAVGTPAPFRNHPITGQGTGIVSGGVVTLPGSIIATPGGSVWLQLRAWTIAAGDTFEAAEASAWPYVDLGMSPPLHLSATGNPTSMPPGVPVSLDGLQPCVMWRCIPEPPSYALAAAGLGVLLALRCLRRTSANRSAPSV